MSAQMAFVTTGISGASCDASCWLVKLSYTKQGQKNLISLEKAESSTKSKNPGNDTPTCFFWVCMCESIYSMIIIRVCLCVCVRLSMLQYLVRRTCIPWGRPFACRLSVDGLDAGIGREDIQKRGMPVAGCSDNII